MKTSYPDILNALSEMQASGAYALRRPILAQVEQLILRLESELRLRRYVPCGPDQTPAGQAVNWNHDVTHVVGVNHPQGNHIIMRHSRFSLCGAVMKDQKLAYVGAWDSGAPATCEACKDVWEYMRLAARENGVEG